MSKWENARRRGKQTKSDARSLCLTCAHQCGQKYVDLYLKGLAQNKKPLYFPLKEILTLLQIFCFVFLQNLLCSSSWGIMFQHDNVPVWKNLTNLDRPPTSFNTFGINYMPGCLAKHQCWTTVMLLCLNGANPCGRVPKSCGKPSQKDVVTKWVLKEMFNNATRL